MKSNSDLILRQDEPENLESPCSAFDSYLTPEPLFYVRNHFKVPETEIESWRLCVEGSVEHTREFTYDELLLMPSRTLVATIECAGNSRAFLPGEPKGVPWHWGAVGNAEWTGVPLAVVLAEAGLRPDVSEIVLEGADSGAIHEAPETPGVIRFARSLPLQKALSPDVLLAYSMNGKKLTARHGFPVRAVVPGWYGMASVKWLERIIASSRPFAGYFETFEYSHWIDTNGIATLAPLGPGEVKAEILRPSFDEVIQAGETYRVFGAAWAGESEISAVAVSVDGGQSWTCAQLIDTPREYCWVRWEYFWRTPAESASITLMARATDKSGRTQPFEHAPAKRHYSVHYVVPVPVRLE